MDYESDIDIDETSLDIEWLEQARLMLRYCKHAAETRRSMDLAKESLDVERAKLDQEIRADPESFHIVKVTEGSIQNVIIAHTRYQDKMRRYIGSKYEHEMAQAAVRSFEHRKSALENLVRLHGMSYFAGPSVPRDLTIERQTAERNKSANEKVTIKRRRQK